MLRSESIGRGHEYPNRFGERSFSMRGTKIHLRIQGRVIYLIYWNDGNQLLELEAAGRNSSSVTTIADDSLPEYANAVLNCTRIRRERTTSAGRMTGTN